MKKTYDIDVNKKINVNETIFKKDHQFLFSVSFFSNLSNSPILKRKKLKQPQKNLQKTQKKSLHLSSQKGKDLHNRDNRKFFGCLDCEVWIRAPFYRELATKNLAEKNSFAENEGRTNFVTPKDPRTFSSNICRKVHTDVTVIHKKQSPIY